MTSIKDALEAAHGKFCKIAGAERWTHNNLDGWQESPGALREYAEAAAKEIDGVLASLTASPDREKVALRRIVLDQLNAVAPAVENLASNQEQADMDGCMVKVSRQALDEVLNAINEVAIQAATAATIAPDEAAIRAERPLGDVFNELVRRMNFDGMDPRTFTLGELERAIDGAEFPE